MAEAKAGLSRHCSECGSQNANPQDGCRDNEQVVFGAYLERCWILILAGSSAAVNTHVGGRGLNISPYQVRGANDQSADQSHDAARVVCVILHRGLCKQFGIKRIRPPSRLSPAPKKHSTKAAQINQPALGWRPAGVQYAFCVNTCSSALAPDPPQHIPGREIGQAALSALAKIRQWLINQDGDPTLYAGPRGLLELTTLNPTWQEPHQTFTTL